MPILAALLRLADRVRPPAEAFAHCDLPCGVYDPSQARIEAESVRNCMVKHNESDDPQFKQRAILIKEQRADLTKHHLWVLWTDYFTTEHAEAHPGLHDLFWRATKLAGEAKQTTDVAVADALLDAIGEVDRIFKATQAG